MAAAEQRTNRHSAAPSTQVYWDSAAETYDHDFTETLIGQTRREAVWRKLDRSFHPGQRVLELNCGTGIDALHLAERGVRVIACDISRRMVELAREHAGASRFDAAVDFRVLPTEQIAALSSEGPFDGVFSNFAGLNCVEDLGAVARDLQHLLRRGAPVLLCMLGRFVPWEIMWFLAHGRPRRAFERLGRGSARAVDGGILKVRYPTVNQIARAFEPGFRLRRWTGLGVTVPPSYMEHWARRFPDVTRVFASADRGLGMLPVLRSMADSVLLEFEHRGIVRAGA